MPRTLPAATELPYTWLRAAATQTACDFSSELGQTLPSKAEEVGQPHIVVRSNRTNHYCIGLEAPSLHFCSTPPLPPAAETGRLLVLRLLTDSSTECLRPDDHGDRPSQVAQLYGFSDTCAFLTAKEQAEGGSPATDASAAT
eukprot:m.186882 g.186882  ORF g.186882 m.186882 type:complete len:142 (-) comp18147_c0_seq4:71-496(-)